MRNLKVGLNHLTQADPVMAGLITRFGTISYDPSPDRFVSLVSSIIGQQLSNKAADTIYSRFVKLFPDHTYTPQAIMELPDQAIRDCGTSWAKIASLKDLSTKVLTNVVRLNDLDSMSDEQVIDHLTQVRGIGRWTAEMKLMFTLHRPDVLPLADVGIQNAFVLNYGLNRSHDSFLSNMQKIARPWQPWRTVACWYLWKSLDNKE